MENTIEQKSEKIEDEIDECVQSEDEDVELMYRRASRVRKNLLKAQLIVDLERGKEILRMWRAIDREQKAEGRNK